MRDMRLRDDGSVHFVYDVPTRGLLGFRQHFLTATRGEGIMNSIFNGYRPFSGEIPDARAWIADRLGAWELLPPMRCLAHRSVAPSSFPAARKCTRA